MRNVRKFETFEDFLATQEAFSGSGNYVLDVKPGFVYIKERFPDGKYAVYNGTEEDESCDFVDLGLPSGTLWATKNVGAENPEDVGDVFAWGEILTKDSFTPENYKWYDTNAEEVTKYNYNDGKSSLDLEDDVAYMANPKCGFHMPSVQQWYELVDNCVINNQYDDYSIFTSKINGNSVIFPFISDYDWRDGDDYCENTLFWLNQLGNDIYQAYTVFSVCEGTLEPNSVDRFNRAPVRGVIGGGNPGGGNPID